MYIPEGKKNNLGNSIEMFFYLSPNCEDIALQYIERIRIIKTEELITESNFIDPRINLGKNIEEILKSFHPILISKIDAIQTVVQNQKVFPCDIVVKIQNDLTFNEVIPKSFFQAIYQEVQQYLQERKINYREVYSIPLSLKI